MGNLEVVYFMMIIGALLSFQTAASNDTVLSHSCYLSTAENATFLELGFALAPRAWDEIIAATSVSWAPSTDVLATMLVIGNDTTVPTFWLHAIPTAAATSSELVDFFDSRFELCIRFSCAGVTCSSNTNPTVCSSGSSVRPGQFRFQSVVLAIGSWYFSAYSLTFTPLDEVVLFPAATPLFFCANVTQPLTFRNISSVRFSPRVNRGLLYHRKTICAAVGITLDPITVHAFPVKNSSLLEQGGLVADPTILDGTAAVFRLRVLSGASQDSASVISTWNISVFVNNPAEATFRNVTISKYIPSASIVIDVVQQGVVVYNYLVLFLNLAAAPINLCSLEIPQQRNQPFLFTLGMAWGATLSVGASMPTIFVAARRSDGSYSEGLGGGDFFSPLLVSAVGYSVEGKPFPLSGGTTTPLANGVATFSSLVLAAESASYEFMWIQFQISSGGTTVATCLSFPLKLSRSATAARFAIDQRGESRFSVAGSLQYGTVNSALPPIRLVLQDSYFHRILPTSIKTAVVSVRSCYSDWETITSTGLSSIIPWCSNVTESVPVSLSGATSVSFSQTGIASLMNVTFSPNFVFANASTVVNVLMVISVDDAAIYFPLVLSHPSAPPLRSVVRFQPGVTASLFTANFQSTHAVLGSPLPPIILLLMFPNGTIDRRNVSLSVSVSCAGAVLRHATSYFQYGVAQVPGVVVEHSQTSVIRLSFLIYLIESSTGARVRMHKLESGAIQLVSFTKLSTADASSLPFALQFSRTRGFISYGVKKQDVLNSTILPPFEVALVRADHLLAGVRQSTRATSSNSSSSLQSNSISCDIGVASNITSLTASIVNGTAQFSFSGLIEYSSTLTSLTCCLQVREAPFSCVSVELDVDSLLAFDELPITAAVSVSMLPQLTGTGISIPSPFLAVNSAFDSNRSMTVGGQLDCLNSNNLFGNCARSSNVDITFDFTLPVRNDESSIDAVLISGATSQINDVTVGSFDTLVVDGIEAVSIAVVPHNYQRLVNTHGSKGWPVDSLPISFYDTYVFYGDRTLTQVVDTYLWLERFSDLSGVESNRLLIGPPRPAIFDRSISGVVVPNIQGVLLEMTILPRIALSSVIGERRIANQILGVSLSCAQQSLSTVATSIADDISFVAGFATLAHGHLFTGSVQSLTPSSFCDVSLFETLAESARHCEIFEGSSSRCQCLVPVFGALGSLCIGQRILVDVCDHAAYCNDDAITSVCNQIQPNVALQVFYVVGGTILGLVVIIAIVKVKAIARFISQAKYRMNHNEDNVQSKQSAASINIFSS